MRSFRANPTVVGFWVFGLVIGTLIGIPFTFAALSGNAEMPGLAILWVLLFVGGGWFLFLMTGTHVTLGHDGSVTCKAIARTGRFQASDVTEIRGWIFVNPFLVTIVHRTGKMWIVGRMDGLADLIAEFKRANPSVLLKGI